jgi:hypothetical protein
MANDTAVVGSWRDQRSAVAELQPWVLDQLDGMFVMASVGDGVAEFESDVREWAMASGMFPPETAGELAAAQLGVLACHLIPETPVEVRWLVAMYNAWLTAVDDGVVEQGIPVDHLAPVVDSVLREGVTPADAGPSVACLVRLRVRLVGLGAEALLPELADAFARLFGAWAREQHWVRTGRLPTAAEFIPHHGCTMGTYPIALLHRAKPGLLPPEQRFPFALRQIVLETATVIGLHNDLVGLPGDLARDEHCLNTVTVLAGEYGWDLPTACRAAVVLLADRWAALNQLVTEFCLRPNVAPTQVRQARAIRRYADGFHRWHRTAPRYTELADERHRKRDI